MRSREDFVYSSRAIALRAGATSPRWNPKDSRGAAGVCPSGISAGASESMPRKIRSPFPFHQHVVGNAFQLREETRNALFWRHVFQTKLSRFIHDAAEALNLIVWRNMPPLPWGSAINVSFLTGERKDKGAVGASNTLKSAQKTEIIFG